MKKYILHSVLVAGLLALVAPAHADDNDDIIKEVMKTCNSAPKGTDSICKKAISGKASADEMAKLVSEYKKLTTTTAPKGDQADWKAKTTKLYEAAENLQKDPATVADFKAAVNCMACHKLHRPPRAAH